MVLILGFYLVTLLLNMSFVPWIIWYKWGFATTERLDMNSNTEISTNGWQQLTANHGSIQTSWGYAYCSPAANDSTPYILKTFWSKVPAFEFSCELYLQPSSWWSTQSFWVCWGDFPTFSWYPSDSVSFTAQEQTAWWYTSASLIWRGTDNSFQWMANGSQPNGNYVFRIKFSWSLYTCSVETTWWSIIASTTYSSTRQPTQVWMELRVWFTSENYCKCNWIELKY